MEKAKMIKKKLSLITLRQFIIDNPSIIYLEDAITTGIEGVYKYE